MSNLVIGYINNVLTGALAGSSSVVGLDVSQLQNEQGNPSFAWQTTGVGTATLTITGSAPWRAFGLFRTNLTLAATVTVTVRNGGSGGTVVYSGSLAALVSGYGQMLVVAPAQVTGDWCQFSISDATNPSGYFNIPLAYAGPVFQPIRNASWNSTYSRTSQSTKAQTRAGGVIVRNDWIKRVYDCSFAGLKASELPTVGAIEIAGLRGSNILFVPDPSSATITQEAIFGEFEPANPVTYPYEAGDARGYRAIITERL